MNEEYDKQGMIKAYVNLGIQFNEANARIKTLENHLKRVAYDCQSWKESEAACDNQYDIRLDEIKALRERIDRALPYLTIGVDNPETETTVHEAYVHSAIGCLKGEFEKDEAKNE